MDVTVLPDLLAVADEAADLVEVEVAAHGGIAFGLAGGSTPHATYHALTQRHVDWSTSLAWMTDERWVDSAHPESNQRMVREAFTDRSRIAFIAPETSGTSPHIAAESFTNTILEMVPPAKRSVTLLGMGTDGHTASLFPGTAALEVKGPRYVANFVPKLDTWRLTASFDLIARSDIVIFLVCGRAKADAVSRIAAGEALPAASVSAREHVIWLLDEPAAALL